MATKRRTDNPISAKDVIDFIMAGKLQAGTLLNKKLPAIDPPTITGDLEISVMKINGSLNLLEGCTIQGNLIFRAVNITGNLNLQYLTVEGKVSFDGVTVDGDLLLSDLETKGIKLDNFDIEGQVKLSEFKKKK